MFSDNGICKGVIIGRPSKLVIYEKTPGYIGLIQTCTAYDIKIIVPEYPERDLLKLATNVVKITNGTDQWFDFFGPVIYMADSGHRYMIFRVNEIYDYVLRDMIGRDIPSGGCELTCRTEISDDGLVVTL